MRLSYLLASIIIPTALHANDAFPEADLWLPKTYEKHFSTLAKVAAIVQEDPYCERLVSGRLLESRSTIDHLIFHFRCLDKDRTSFYIQVDGNTLELTNPYGENQRRLEEAAKKEEERRLAEAEAEEARKKAEEQAESEREEAERLAALQREQSRYWGICRRAMKKRLKTFDNVTVLATSPPEPTVEEQQFTYLVDFDAESPAKRALHFSVQCIIDGLESYQVSVFPRKKNNSR